MMLSLRTLDVVFVTVVSVIAINTLSVTAEAATATATESPPPKIVASFVGQVNYAWDENHQESAYLASGKYIPSVNVITGIKIKPGVRTNPRATEVFLAVPRWFNGIPSTLNKITIDVTQPELSSLNIPLEPFPSWDMQTVGDCTKIQYIQSMEVDCNGHLWAIDTGRVGIFTDTPNNTCPPKLLILDTQTGEMIDEPYIFPAQVAPYDSVFLNDIVVSTDGAVAYITDMTGNGIGGLITYDRANRVSHRFYDDSMAPELGLIWKFKSNDLGRNSFAQPIQAIALLPDNSRVFYSALQGLSTYSVDARALRGIGDAPPQETIISHGFRQGPTDGFTIDCAGYLYYSDLNSASVYRWNTSSSLAPISNAELVAQNVNEMWWTDTYAWDDANYLWATANHLPDVFVNGTFTKVNIFRIQTATGNYQKGICDPSRPAEPTDSYPTGGGCYNDASSQELDSNGPFVAASPIHKYIVATFTEINYAWDDNHVEAEYLVSGEYNRPINVITGIKIKAGAAANPAATEVFLSVPRWLNGVPSTLNKIIINLTECAEISMNAPLEPFPCWDMQTVGDCNKIQYVQSFEIDNNGLMWVIDTGRVGIFTGSPDNTCPPKILIFDTTSGEMIDEPFILPPDVAPYDSAFLNDIVVDDVQNICYITDMTGYGIGGLITYDRTHRVASRFYNETMAPDMNLTWYYKDQNLGENAFAQPIQAIALTPDKSRIFYGALQGINTYSIDATALRGGDVPPEDTIISHGTRQGPSDGFTIDCAGYLYYSDLNTASFYKWDTSSTSPPSDSGELVASDIAEMWWTDTFGWDDADFLWVTANHLPAVFANGTFEKTNILRVPTSTGSYQKGVCSPAPTTSEGEGSGDVVIGGGSGNGFDFGTQPPEQSIGFSLGAVPTFIVIITFFTTTFLV